MELYKQGCLQVGKHTLRIDRKISEGGFGFVFQATDINTHLKVALKQINIHDSESKQVIENEIRTWK